jgi:hypothetical protein
MSLIVGLGFLLALYNFAAGGPLPKRGGRVGIGAPTKKLARSQAAAGSNQAETLPDLIIVQAPEVRPGPLAQRFPQGSRLAKVDTPNIPALPLTSDLFAAADPRISVDGTQVLFSGKQSTHSTWQIYEMSTDGSGARQVTHCPGDCLKPAYMPRGQIVYTALPSKQGNAPCGALPDAVPPAVNSASQAGFGSQICFSRADGTAAHPITFGPGDFQVETVLKNGMILASARLPLLPSSGLPADRELYTLRPDGTGLGTLRCDHEHPAIRSQAQELDDGAVVFVKSSLNSSNLGGDLAWIRRGAVHNAPLTSAPILASSPQPMAADVLLVARESGPTTGRKFTLYAFDAAVGRFTTPVFQDPKLSTVEAVPVAAHEAPRWYWSTLKPELHRGYFICLDSHLADGAPQGRITAKLSRVRVLTLDAATRKEITLGEAPVEEDGSFYIAVPPDAPVRFETLDAAGRVVREQRSWIWSRSGEEHGCVGCHEDRALAPENRWPMALRSFDTPTRLDVKGTRQMGR